MFGDLNEKQSEYLKDIYASGQHLLSLINDILDLSKIEAGRMELESADFDLPSAIDNALTLVRERATRRGITLGRTVDDRLGIIRGDERKVKQILLNLLSTALKFTPEGGRIDVSAQLEGRGGGDCRRGYWSRHRPRGSGGDLRGIPAGRHRRQEGRRHGPRAGPLAQIHRASWRPDRGQEPARRGLNVHVLLATRTLRLTR